MTNGKEDHSMPAIQGKYLGIFICWLLGNGCLFGFNSMLTIEDYFVYLFPNCHPTRVVTLTYQPFVLTISAIFAYHEAKVSTKLRNLVGYTLFFFSSLALVILNVATSGRGGIATFIGVCIIVAVFGIAEGHVEGAMTGDLSLMCPEFIQSFSAGMAASGAITSALRLVTKAAFENSRDGLRKGAMLFFSMSCFFELLCVLLYAYVLPKLPIVKFYRAKAASEGSLTVIADLAASGMETHPNRSAEEGRTLPERLSNKQLLLQNMDYALDVFLIYMLTLSVFPGFLAEDVGSHSLGSWYALVLIASYNAWDLIGRYLPLITRIKLTSRRGLSAAVRAPPGVLPRGEARRVGGLDGRAGVGPRAGQRLPHRLRPHRGTQRVQGAGAERPGKPARVLPLGGHILRGCAGLALARRQRMVIGRRMAWPGLRVCLCSGGSLSLGRSVRLLARIALAM